MKKLILVLFLLVMVSDYSFAIPAFARKYNMTCKTCHSPFPNLKPYGDEFAGNGFVLSDQDAPRYFVETGDDELNLIRDIPLALRLEGYLTYNNGNQEQFDMTAPYLLKLLSGGTIAKDVSYYFYFFLSERGDVAGIEDAFIMFNNLIGELDVYVGQFQISDPLFKRELRLTLDDYQIYRTKIGTSNLDLTYDRGIMLTYGFDTGTNLTFQLLNGSGIGSANVFRNFDNDKFKNYLGRVSQDIGDHFRIGAFGFWGKEKISDVVDNEVNMFGPDLSVTIDPLELNVQYLYRVDQNQIPEPTAERDTEGGFAELIYRPDGDNSKWYAVGLYNFINSNIESYDLETITGHFGYMLNRNVRLTTEFTYNVTNEFGTIGVGFVTAF
ncbi:MAG: hypothetical protein R6W90_09995 [Ignavibacteriaceae bacterium]